MRLVFFIFISQIPFFRIKKICNACEKKCLVFFFFLFYQIFFSGEESM